jgi:competence protein ComEA
MKVYNRKQLTVIICILSIAFPYAIMKAYRIHTDTHSTAVRPPSAIYEIRGDVKKEGFYYFSDEQAVPGLLQAAGGSKDKTGFIDTKGDAPVIESGKKIVFKTDPLGYCSWEIQKMVAAARLNFFMPVAINSASVDELMLIPGIGNRTAETIVEYRRAHNGIKDLHGLTRLPGLGEKKVQSLLPFVTTDQ